VQRLFSDIAERFKDRPGGYTRIVKLGTRAGDAASMSLIELTGTSESVEPAKKRRGQRRAKSGDATAPRKGARAAAG
jgi:large subunit ribosomal protein L17